MKSVQFALTEIGFFLHRPLLSTWIIKGMGVLLRSIAGRIYLAHEMGLADERIGMLSWMTQMSYCQVLSVRRRITCECILVLRKKIIFYGHVHPDNNATV